MQNNQTTFNIKEFAESLEIFDICESIGSDLGLHIDQVSELDSEIRGILLGTNKSADFVNHIIQRLEIDNELAQKVVNEVNQRIFSTLRTKMQNSGQILSSADNVNFLNAPPKPPHIADLEKAGGFTIEHDGVNNLGRGVGDEEGVGSDNLRAVPARNKWSPLGQTVIPTRNLGSIPVAPPNQQNVTPNTVPASVSAPIQDQNPTQFTAPISTPVPPPTPTIPKKIETPTPIVNQTPIVETKPEIKTNIQEEIEKEIASALKSENISPIKTEKTTPVVPEVSTEKVPSEPLADQLLSMLNKKTVEKDAVQTEKRGESIGEKISTIPSNLPTEEKTTEIPTKNPEVKTPEFTTKNETVSTQTPVIPTPIKINIQPNITPPSSPTATNVPPPIKVPTNLNPVKPKPSTSPRSFDPYREPIK